AGGYVDERGRSRSAAPAARCLETDAAGAVVVLHGSPGTVDAGLTGAVSRALRLTAEHALLQAEVRDQLAELDSSRRRLVLARGRQQALMARRLREGVERNLNRVDAMLAAVESGEPVVADGVTAARRQ